jgi:glycosyltransferase involved in cell wall biosynthesis
VCAKKDLLQFFPESEKKIQVLRFMCTLKSPDNTDSIDSLEEKYCFRGKFFYLPNQYWAHKNHKVVIRATSLLRKMGHNVLVISTGKTDDYRQPNFFNSLIGELDDAGDGYRVLGVIPYPDVSLLMQHSVGLINPSYFEGWSSTVEEAKAFGKPMILSNIPVHKEQAIGVASFFNPDDVEELATLMLALWDSSQKLAEPDFSELRKKNIEARKIFSQNYLRIIDSACRK